ncbi:MAG: SMP-30/gluconolactonase/LRE family protein, partial [Thermoanaerobaculia bacterium]
RIYFSDPRYVGDEPRELERESVYRIEGPGSVSCAVDDVDQPNGLAVSPDGALLYVSDTAARKLYAYRLAGAGKLRRERIVFDFAPGRAIDGLEVDRRGIIYGAAGEGERSGVYAISPAGELLEFIPVSETATNCAFGGLDGRSLYITAGKSLYRIAVETPGFAVFPASRR